MATEVAETEFNLDEYMQYVPESVQEFVRENHGKFGSKNRVKWMQDIAKYSNRIADRTDKLVNSCKVINRTTSPRDSGRKYLESLSEDALRTAAEHYNVSWSSFVPAGTANYAELIEAILDEMSKN